ncbi:uncharacterized protein LOC108139151 [Drosophila elegans]|uniref:uncharacterized protein LOC108139151 n=1 Tax=Drosophila elegans TaxID=30023 RepID=UPI0007E762B5|nr:uncharacterized protein LOC108139151 [Drosophila elegans]
MFFPCLLVAIWLGVLLIHDCGAARKWDYEPISVTALSSDESLVKFEPKIIRMGRGELGISADVLWNYDTSEETMVSADVYRSTSGDERDYKLLPWKIPNQPLYEYLDNYYKDVIVKNFAPCSNLPQFEGKFEPPIPKQTYTADKCVFEGDGLPEIAPPGFYKIIFNCTGPDQPTWSLEAIIKLTNKMF